MKLTARLKKQIDDLSLSALLAEFLFAPRTHPVLNGDSGNYIRRRVKKLTPKGEVIYIRARQGIKWEKK